MTFTKLTAQRWGEAIRRARNELGLSILDVAMRTGIDPGHLSRAERGLAGIGDDYRASIAEALGTTPESLFTDPESLCPPAEPATDGAASPTPATAGEARSPARSAKGPAASAREGSHGNE